jgi:hypothetical protein
MLTNVLALTALVPVLGSAPALVSVLALVSEPVPLILELESVVKPVMIGLPPAEWVNQREQLVSHLANWRPAWPPYVDWRRLYSVGPESRRTILDFRLLALEIGA